jgi:Zn-dependent peptidase ImmA (M78 family)
MNRLALFKSRELLTLTGQHKPPVSVHQVAGELGIGFEVRDLPDNIPGFVANIAGQWFAFLNSTHGPRRRRFTLAHEIGHVALGHFGMVHLYGEKQADQREANRFAAELLMPVEMVREEHAKAVGAGLSVGDLADIFLVGKRAMEIRLRELGLAL